MAEISGSPGSVYTPSPVETAEPEPLATTPPVTGEATLDAAKDAAGSVENPDATQPPAEALPPEAGVVDVDEPDLPTYTYEAPDIPTTSAGTGTLAESADVPTPTESSRREQSMQSATQSYAQAAQSGDAGAANAALDQVAPLVAQSADTVTVAKEDKAEREKEKGMKEIKQFMNGEEVFIKQDGQKLKKMESLAQRQIQVAKQQKNAKAQGEWSQVLDRVHNMQKGVSERKKGAMAQMARDIGTKWDTLKGVKKELVGGEAAKPETAEDKEFAKFFKKMVVSGDFLITTKQEKEQAKVVEERELGGAEPTEADVKADLKEDKTAGKKTKEDIREARKAQREAAAEAKKAAGIQHPDAAKLATVQAKMQEHFAKMGRTMGEGAKLVFKGKKSEGAQASSAEPETGAAQGGDDSGFSITGLFAAISGIFQPEEREGRSGEEQRAVESEVRASALGAYQFAIGGRSSQFAAAETYGTGRAAKSGTGQASEDKVSATGPDAVANLKTVETSGKAAPFVDSVASNKAQHSAQYWNVDHWRGNAEESDYQLSHTQSTHGLPNNRA